VNRNLASTEELLPLRVIPARGLSVSWIPHGLADAKGKFYLVHAIVLSDPA